MRSRSSAVAFGSWVICVCSLQTPSAAQGWTRHVVFEGEPCMTAVAGDFNRDGRPDIIADTGKGTTRLFLAPDWQEVVLDNDHQQLFIHSETMDVDGDGDPDYIGACYEPGLIVWYEQPADGARMPWRRRLIDNQINGIHGVIQGDVNQDGRPDLLATSAQPKPPFPDSLAWFSAPDDPLSDAPWQRHLFAVEDAPGLTHYLGFGDVNGDGRPDAATGAKGGPTDTTMSGEWFAWWEAPEDPTAAWKKHPLPGPQPGATNIHPADINGDGTTDLVASRGHGQGVLWLEGPTWQTHVIDADIQEPHCLAAADLDRDGDIDAATCAYGSRVCVWYENDGTGQFRRHLVGDNQEAYDIRIVDLNGDGALDLLVAGRLSNNVVWYEQPAQNAQSGQ